MVKCTHIGYTDMKCFILQKMKECIMIILAEQHTQRIIMRSHSMTFQFRKSKNRDLGLRVNGVKSILRISIRFVFWIKHWFYLDIVALFQVHWRIQTILKTAANRAYIYFCQTKWERGGGYILRSNISESTREGHCG